jgi:hypothetical protein
VFFKPEENIFLNLKKSYAIFSCVIIGFFLRHVIRFFLLKQEKQLLLPPLSRTKLAFFKLIENLFFKKKNPAILFFLHFGHTEIHS